MSNTLVVVLLISFLTVFALAIFYHGRPFSALPDKKPRIAFFPKYRSDPVSMRTVKKNLDKMKFKKIDDTNYVRGSLFGEFSLKFLKLRVELFDDYFQIKSGGAVLLFDTGDMWKLTKALSGDDE